MRRAHKYSAVATVVDNVRFSSKAEARRYAELRLLEKAGAIRELELQPKFPLHVGHHARHHERVMVTTYVADFRYREGPHGMLVVEDTKGFRTPVYKLKCKMVLAEYGIAIRET
jgi:Protein of unknown function (DUF1064)